MAKRYEIKVYGLDGAYLTTWNEVVSKVTFNNEVNTAGGQMVITLARDAGDYGEGSDVDFGLRVVVSCIDVEAPEGTTVFQGYITSYTPVYKTNNIIVTVLSYGAQLSNFFFEKGGSITELLFSEAVGAGGAGQLLFGIEDYTGAYNDEVAVEFSPDTTGELSAISTHMWLNASGVEGTTYADMTVELWSGTVLGGGLLLATTEGRQTSSSFILALSLYISQWHEYSGSSWLEFETPATITTGQTYHLKFIPNVLRTYVQGAAFGIFAGAESDAANKIYTKNTKYGYTLQTGDGCIALWESATVTTIPYLSKDPSYIMEQALDVSVSKGGKATYTPTSIDDTGTVVTYTFSTNTILEVINKALELAPKNWYWYLDYGTNLIHFKEKATTPDHVFALEKDLIDAKFEKRIEDIVNVVYFTGGDDGTGENLFVKYQDDNSIAEYGIRAVKYNDSRVTVEATAATIANSILETKSQPELRVTLVVLDSNNNQDKGYDIESIQVGDLVAVRNVNQQVGLSTWDVARWDESYWDYNIYNLSSLQMQVQKLTYNEDSVTIFASTIAVDVNKRIEDINRNLEALQSQDNPEAPA